MSNFYKKHKKQAGRCPLCQKELKVPKEELLKLLELASESGLITKQMIKDRYKELSKIHHPDKPTGSQEKFQQITQAKEDLLELLDEEDYFNIDPIEQATNFTSSSGDSKTNDNSASTSESESSTNPTPEANNQTNSTQQQHNKRTYDYDQYQQIKQTILNMKRQMRPGSPCSYCKKPI